MKGLGYSNNLPIQSVSLSHLFIYSYQNKLGKSDVCLCVRKKIKCIFYVVYFPRCKAALWNMDSLLKPKRKIVKRPITALQFAHSNNKKKKKAGLLDKDKLILIDVLKVNSTNCLRGCEITGWVNSALHNITGIDESIKSRRPTFWPIEEITSAAYHGYHQGSCQWWWWFHLQDVIRTASWKRVSVLHILLTDLCDSLKTELK